MFWKNWLTLVISNRYHFNWRHLHLISEKISCQVKSVSTTLWFQLSVVDSESASLNYCLYLVLELLSHSNKKNGPEIFTVRKNNKEHPLWPGVEWHRQCHRHCGSIQFLQVSSLSRHFTTTNFTTLNKIAALNYCYTKDTLIFAGANITSILG